LDLSRKGTRRIGHVADFVPQAATLALDEEQNDALNADEQTSISDYDEENHAVRTMTYE